MSPWWFKIKHYFLRNNNKTNLIGNCNCENFAKLVKNSLEAMNFSCDDFVYEDFDRFAEYFSRDGRTVIRIYKQGNIAKSLEMYSQNLETLFHALLNLFDVHYSQRIYVYYLMMNDKEFVTKNDDSTTNIYINYHNDICEMKVLR